MCMFYVNVYIYILYIQEHHPVMAYSCIFVSTIYRTRWNDTILFWNPVLLHTLHWALASNLCYLIDPAPSTICFTFHMLRECLTHGIQLLSLSLSDAKSTKCISIVMPRRLGLCIRYECTYAFLPHTTSTYIIHTVDSSHKSTFIRLAIT